MAEFTRTRAWLTSTEHSFVLDVSGFEHNVATAFLVGSAEIVLPILLIPGLGTW